jgi:hypothetical protein
MALSHNTKIRAVEALDHRTSIADDKIDKTRENLPARYIAVEIRSAGPPNE